MGLAVAGSSEIGHLRDGWAECGWQHHLRASCPYSKLVQHSDEPKNSELDDLVSVDHSEVSVKPFTTSFAPNSLTDAMNASTFEERQISCCLQSLC